MSEQPLALAAPLASGAGSLDAPPLTLGFLTILQDVTGWIGGYLVTNSWGRPLEFRLTTAVQPNRVQKALYGPTLQEYVFADLIGKTLVEKSSTPVSLIVTELVPLWTLRKRIPIPLVIVASHPMTNSSATELLYLEHPRARQGVWLPVWASSDGESIKALLDQIDPAVELSEPFSRIREAVAEARKLGANHRAA
ncbi:MAG: hypothetical protein WHU94_03335 [Thermogemmata sp.]|nr:hypothetical protein [Gemmataceae bacterium]GIW84660.1 MAG: hypothetical protein KatS3mg107_0320 [Gemmataceae bacterium]